MAFRRRISDEPWYIHTPKEGALYRERERDLNNNKRLYIYISLSLSSLGSSCTELIMTDSPPPLFIYIYTFSLFSVYMCVIVFNGRAEFSKRECAFVYASDVHARAAAAENRVIVHQGQLWSGWWPQSAYRGSLLLLYTECYYPLDYLSSVMEPTYYTDGLSSISISRG